MIPRSLRFVKDTLAISLLIREWRRSSWRRSMDMASVLGSQAIPSTDLPSLLMISVSVSPEITTAFSLRDPFERICDSVPFVANLLAPSASFSPTIL